jgi:hypothetical protein
MDLNHRPPDVLQVSGALAPELSQQMHYSITLQLQGPKLLARASISRTIRSYPPDSWGGSVSRAVLALSWARTTRSQAQQLLQLARLLESVSDSVDLLGVVSGVFV